MDSLNTYKTSARYERCTAAPAFRLNQRLEIRYTPKHGSWFNITGIELGALNAQIVGCHSVKR